MLRVIALICWAGVVIFMFRGAAAAALSRNMRRGDPMRLACFATAIVNAGFSARWLMAADNELIWKLLYVLSAAAAIYIIVLGRRYGRGPLIEGLSDGD